MIWNWKKEKGDYPSSIIKINKKSVKNVDNFKYLGVWNNYEQNSIGSKELNYRIGAAAGAFAQHKQLLTNKNIWLSTRVKYLNSFVRSRLVYGCQSWKPTAKEIEKMDVKYRYYLRTLLRNGFQRRKPPKKKKKKKKGLDDLDDDDEEDEDDESVDFSYVVSNSKLFELTKTTNLSDFFKKQQKSWVAHIIRQPNYEVTKQLLFEATKNRKRGRKNDILSNVLRENSKLTSDQQFFKDCFTRRIM